MRSHSIGHVRALLPRAVLICSLAFSACVSTGAGPGESESSGAVIGDSVSPGEFPVLYIRFNCTSTPATQHGGMTMILGGGEDGCSSACSGVKVTDRHILTAAHCTGSAYVGATIEVDRGDGRSSSLTVTNVSTNTEDAYANIGGVFPAGERNDIAVIEVSGDIPGETATIGTTPVAMREEATVVGGGANGSMRRKTVVLRKFANEVGISPKIVGPNPGVTEPGDSGGGVFQQRTNGAWILVGIVYGPLSAEKPCDRFTWTSDATSWLRGWPCTFEHEAGATGLAPDPSTAPDPCSVSADTTALVAEYPSVLGIQGCSGVIVADRLILTSARCVQRANIEAGKVLGVGRPGGEAQIRVKGLFPYDGSADQDVVMIETEAAIPIGSKANILLSRALTSGETTALVRSWVGGCGYGVEKLDVVLAPDAAQPSELVGAGQCGAYDDDGAGAFQTLPTGEVVLVGIARGCQGNGTPRVFTFTYDIGEWLQRVAATAYGSN
jgi:hypothetical protein